LTQKSLILYNEITSHLRFHHEKICWGGILFFDFQCGCRRFNNRPITKNVLEYLKNKDFPDCIQARN